MLQAALTALVTVLVMVAYGAAAVALAIAYRVLVDWLTNRHHGGRWHA